MKIYAKLLLQVRCLLLVPELMVPPEWQEMQLVRSVGACSFSIEFDYSNQFKYFINELAEIEFAFSLYCLFAIGGPRQIVFQWQELELHHLLDSLVMALGFPEPQVVSLHQELEVPAQAEA